MIEAFNWVKSFYIPPSLEERARAKLVQLENERFDAMLNKIQWEFSVMSKDRQIQAIEDYLEGK
jgi:hypothetical protein